MSPVHFTIDGFDVTADAPRLSVRDMLRLASDSSDADKYSRVLIDPDGNEYISMLLPVKPQPGSCWRTRE